MAISADAGESGRGAEEGSSVGNNDGIVGVKAEKAGGKDAAAGVRLMESVEAARVLGMEYGD